jgi:hypothetical protein
MRKFSSLFIGATLPVIVGLVVTGCKTEQKQAAPAPAASSMQSSSTTTTQPAAKPAPAPATSTAQATPAKLPTIRVKAGASEAFKDSAGNVWQADQGFDGGDVVARPDAQISNTKEPGLYQSEHYSMSSFSVKVPNGKYVAKLHFCETFEGITGKGDRVFSVNVQNGQKMIKDLDVFDKAGGANKAYVETVPVDVTNGVFKIDFISNVENPQINAIELAPAS